MIYMFDIDGTLTEPRQPMADDFASFFIKWMDEKIVFLVTGSDLSKVQEQVPKNILDKCRGIFTCMGNELWMDGKLVYRNSVDFPEPLIGWLWQQVEHSEYPVKRSNNLEYRPGMLNFSTIGRTATLEQRKDYFLWDKQTGERQRIVNFINRKYPDFEACIGGQISIDIQPIGKNKKQALEWVVDKYDEPVYFFGDHCDDGGNDSAIAEELDKPWSNGYYSNVTGPDNLVEILIQLEDEC